VYHILFEWFLKRSRVDFTNILQATLRLRSQKHKNVSQNILFALLESLRVKFTHKMLMNLTPMVNFINILPADPESIKIQLSHQYFLMLFGPARLKASHKMLMKLTPREREKARKRSLFYKSIINLLKNLFRNGRC